MTKPYILAVLSLAFFACGQPVLEAEDSVPVGNEPTAEQVAEEMAGYNWHGQEDTSGEVEALWCALEYVEPCPAAGYGTCAVRCCDDALFKSFQVCGNCGTWASGACANHGTRKRIRWE